MRALVISNMQPSADNPARGSFVRDQVAALRRLAGIELEHHEFPPGARALAGAAAGLRRRYRHQRFDVVHAHFGLSAWPALAVAARTRVLTLHGTDVRHARTRHATRAVLPRMTLVAAVSASLAREVPGSASGRIAVLPCGVDLERFRPMSRTEARATVGLDPAGTYLLFPAAPGRPGKRYDRALAVAGAVAGRAELLTLGTADPALMPFWVNAANAVLVPSEAEGFGLAVLEALACDVPVLATPVGIHGLALDGVEGALCAPFDAELWGNRVAPHLAEADPRVHGRPRARLFSAERMAERVALAWRALADRP
jgi:glycosyltransferase involved in cell wall biosynthesis